MINKPIAKRYRWIDAIDKHKYTVSIVFSALYVMLVVPLFEAVSFNLPLRTPSQFFVSATIKLAFSAVLCLFVLFAIHFARKLAKHDTLFLGWLKYSVLYAIVMSIFFLLIYPGFWVYDELVVLEGAKNYDIVSWQHIYTNVYHSFCLYLIPSAVGVVIVQILLISLIVGYITAKVKTLLRAERVHWLFFGCFLLIPIVVNNLYPLRLTIYSYALLAVLFRLLLLHMGKIRSVRPVSEFLLVSIVISILMFWRLEGFIYGLLIPLYAAELGIFAERGKVLQSFALGLLALICIISSYSVTQKTKNPVYELTGTLNPLAVILSSGPSETQLDINIERINKVVNAREVSLHPSIDGLGALEATRTPDFQLNMREYYRGYIGILMHNKQSFLQSRLQTFMHTSSIGGFSATIDPIERWRMQDTFSGIFQNFYNSNLMATPFAPDLKLSVTRTLMTMNDTRSLNKAAPYVWTAIPTIMGLFLFSIISLVRKHYYWSLFFTLLIVHCALVFLTAPASFFMYYFPIYLTGNFMLLLYLFTEFPSKECLRPPRIADPVGRRVNAS